MKTLFVSLVLLCNSFAASAHSLLRPDPLDPPPTAEIKYALSLADYLVCENQYSHIREGSTAYFYRTFYAGETYRIVAFSEDDDVQDVDVILYEADGTLYDQDADNSDIAVVDFSPARTRIMKVVFKNYRSYDGHSLSLCRVLVGYK